MTTTETGQIIHGMPDHEYHAHHALSSTRARQLLVSPKMYQWAGDHPQAHKDEFDIGTAVHSKVLGVGSPVEVLEFDDRRTKAYKDAAADARLAGKVPILRRDYEPVEAMSEAVLADPYAAALLTQPGNAEVSMFATCPDTGIPMRARFDYFPDEPTSEGIRAAVDLKTTAKAATGRGFSLSIADFNYDVQYGHYDDVWELISPEPMEMVFVVVEKAAPYHVGLFQLSREWKERGKRRARVARERLALALETGEWPGYETEGVQVVDPPSWVMWAEES